MGLGCNAQWGAAVKIQGKKGKFIIKK